MKKNRNYYFADHTDWYCDRYKQGFGDTEGQLLMTLNQYFDEATRIKMIKAFGTSAINGGHKGRWQERKLCLKGECLI